MTEKPLIFTGIVHPPSKATRDHQSDLSSGELHAVAKGRENGLPVFVEHETDQPSIGQVLTSWEGPRGELKMQAAVTDSAVAAQVRNGTLRGLSLGTDVVLDTDGKAMMRVQKELSLCAEGRRSGTWITHLDGKQVHEVAAFSRKTRTRAS
jgi:hypothetical protein